MSVTQSHAELVERRGELLVELFLEGLAPRFLAGTYDRFPYDYLVGFENAQGGTNTFGVVIAATDGPVEANYRVAKDWYRRLANSNPPVLFLVADSQRELLYYTWLDDDTISTTTAAETMSVPLTKLDDEAKQALKDSMTGKTSR